MFLMMEIWIHFTLRSETFTVSRFLALSAKFYSRDVFRNTLSTKVYFREIVQILKILFLTFEMFLLIDSYIPSLYKQLRTFLFC